MLAEHIKAYEELKDNKRALYEYKYKTEEELNDYLKKDYIAEVSPNGPLKESISSSKMTFERLDELFGDTKEIMPNGLIRYEFNSGKF